MMADYTKGPWDIDGDKHAMNLDIVGPEGRIAMMDCENFEITDEELGANASLIAAAPDLLEALEFIDLSCRMGGVPVGWGLPILKVRAAIAKATGGKA